MKKCFPRVPALPACALASQREPSARCHSRFRSAASGCSLAQRERVRVREKAVSRFEPLNQPVDFNVKSRGTFSLLLGEKAGLRENATPVRVPAHSIYTTHLQGHA